MLLLRKCPDYRGVLISSESWLERFHCSRIQLDELPADNLLHYSIEYEMQQKIITNYKIQLDRTDSSGLSSSMASSLKLFHNTITLNNCLPHIHVVGGVIH